MVQTLNIIGLFWLIITN
jgi:hypothetical protein